MEQDDRSDRPPPRSSEEIFEDLRALAQRGGALHDLSVIIYRDWVVTVDLHEANVIDNPEHRWSTSKLNKNELLLLLGLMVQSETDRTYSVHVTDNSFALSADRLLREFHDRVLADIPRPEIAIDQPLTAAKLDSIGPVAREAIYYGADSIYIHQFAKLSRLRYRDDATWLLQNIGLSIGSLIDIAKFITNRINHQVTSLGRFRRPGNEPNKGELTNTLLIAKSEVRKKFKQKADIFIAKFATKAKGANSGFTDPFAINAVSIAPIIDLGEYLYIPHQYRLFETIYESPYYWMMADKAYAQIEARHRGAFLERNTAHILRSVFGTENVYENVMIRRSLKDLAGEVDVLVVYGEFVLVVQAKSKRVTLKARAGDSEALQIDFEGAIQAPYRQARECVELIRSGCDCISASGQLLKFPSLGRFFPVVILSDPFPASTLLSRNLLERGSGIAPVIWDIGVLDCVARMLPTPIEMIFYLKSRSQVFDDAFSDSEYNFLGFHIRSKLVLPPDMNFMLLDRDFATVVEDYMIAADLGIEAQRPLGVLERFKIAPVTELLAELKNATPQCAAIVIDLYDFSSAALAHLIRQRAPERLASVV
jgi:hypothetical protein